MQINQSLVDSRLAVYLQAMSPAHTHTELANLYEQQTGQVDFTYHKADSSSRTKDTDVPGERTGEISFWSLC